MRKISRGVAEDMCRLLRDALERIRRGQNSGLCFALLDLVPMPELSRRDRIVRSRVAYLRTWILEQLGDNAYLLDWLGEHHHEAYVRYNQKWSAYDYEGERPSYQIRKDWVEWMCNHLMETATPGARG